MPAAGVPGPSGLGLTYVLQAGDTPLYKIGFTRRDIQQRISELQPGCPFKLRLVATIPDRKHETRLHRQHSQARLNGEWFHLPDGVGI